MSSYDKKFIQQCAETWIAIGTCADTIGQVEKAVEAFSTALRYTPNNAKALTHLAHVYRTRDAYAEAADLYRRALALDQHNGETWGLLGHCYLMLDDLQSAYTAYQQALLNLQNLSVPKLWHGIGILYDRYGSLEYAEEAFVRVLEMDPNFDKANEVYFRLGIIYKLQGKLQKALECFQYILNRPPAPLTQTDVWFQIGTVLEQNRDFTGSKEAYERVLQSSPNHSKVLQQLGGLYSQPEAPFYDLDIALQLLNQSIELNNSDAHSWYYLGRVYMSKQDYPNAYESFQHAVNLDSRNPTFWCSIGVLYYKISQYKDALDAYTRAIRLNPYLSEVWYDLGTLYETCNNQIGDALDAYRRAASLDPDNPHIAERLMQLSKYEKEGGALPPPVQTQHQLTMPSHQMIQQQQQQQQQQQHQLNPANGLPLGQQFQLGNAPNLIHQQSNEQLAQAEAQRQAEVQRQAEAQRLAEQQQQQQLAEAQRKAEFDAEEKRKAEAEAEATKRAAGLQKQAEMKAEEEKKQAEKVKKEKAKKEKKDAEEKEKEAQRQRQRQLEINSENRKQAQHERELEMEKQRKFAETAEAEAKAKAEADAETAANAAADAKIKADEEAREQARIHAESEAQAQAQAQAQAEVEAEAENQAKVQAEAEAEANARQLLEAEKVIEPKPETNGAEAVKPPSQGGSQSAGIKSEEQQDSKATSNEVPSSAETSNSEFKGEKRPLEDSDINGNGNTMNGEKKQKITDGKESKENTAPESSNGVLKTNTQSESVPAASSRDVPLEQEQGVDRDNGDDKSGQKDEEKTIDLKPMEVDDVAELKSIAKDKEEELEKKDDNVDAAGIAQNENKVRKIDEDEDYDD